jgi:hypothetical protein
MSAFFGYDDVGVWVSNGERDRFLDWFAEHRCTPGDPRWEFSRSEGHRWPGCGINLNELIPRGEVFEVTPSERAAAAAELCPDFAVLLDIVSAITRGEWTHSVSSTEAVHWRPEAKALEAKWQAEEEALLKEPYRSSSFGAEEEVRFAKPPDDTGLK